MTKYFEIDAVSNSRLNSIDPEMGGSPKKYLNFITEDREKKDSISLERGSILHKYMENKDEFLIADIEKPTEMNCLWTEEMFKNHKDTFHQDEARFYDEVVTTKERLAIHSNTKDKEKVKEKFKKECIDYFKFLEKDDGSKIIMTTATRDIIEKCISTSNTHEGIKKLLNEKETEFTPYIKVFNELEVYWQYRNDTKPVILDCKAKIDRIIIDEENKIVKIIDYKTTSKSISKFANKKDEEGAFFYYKIYRQLAWYGNAVGKFMIEKGYDLEKYDFQFYIIAFETTGDFNGAIFNISDEWLGKGKLELNLLLDRVMNHNIVGWDYSIEEYVSENRILTI